MDLLIRVSYGADNCFLIAHLIEEVSPTAPRGCQLRPVIDAIQRNVLAPDAVIPGADGGQGFLELDDVVDFLGVLLLVATQEIDDSWDVPKKCIFELLLLGIKCLGRKGQATCKEIRIDTIFLTDTRSASWTLPWWMNSSYRLVLCMPSLMYHWKRALELYFWIDTSFIFRSKSDLPDWSFWIFSDPVRLHPPTASMISLRGCAPSSSILPSESKQERYKSCDF